MANYENLTIEDVHAAYRKLKSMAYYDTNDLFLKSKIAAFETERTFSQDHDHVFSFRLIDFKEKLEELHKALTTWAKPRKMNYWEEHLKAINYRVLPKSVTPHPTSEVASGQLIGNFFSNEREHSKDGNYTVDSLTFYIDAPIELHILSVLWITKIGYHLEADLDEKCYGNRLILNKRKANAKGPAPTEDEGLFKPYYKQYQRWRDEGIGMARTHLKEGEDVVFVNIDIKDYYYSVRLNLDRLDDRLKNERLSGWATMIDVFERLHIDYSQKIQKTGYPNKRITKMKDREVILPIGLASSYVLANWYLHEFDSRVKENISPIYYSRYVDDMFIVMRHQPEREEECEDLKITLFDTEEIDITLEEETILKRLNPVITAVKTPPELRKKEEGEQYIFKVNCYEHLFIQPRKTLVYVFNHRASLALLDKFRHEIEKRSSEFRFLPDKELKKHAFDDEAYEMIFDDSQQKIKTLKDYKENRYGLAAHLSKRIYYTLRNGHRNKPEEVTKVLRFFKGTTNLEQFRQWERLLTYFLVNDNKDAFQQFTINTIEQIFKMPIPENFRNFGINYMKIAADLLEYFSIAIEITLALKPQFGLGFQQKMEKTLNRFYQEFLHSNARLIALFQNWQQYRYANIIRHNYVAIPLLNYCKVSIDSSLVDTDLPEAGTNDLTFDEDAITFSPRKVRYWEVAWMTCIQRVQGIPSPPDFQTRIPDNVLYNEQPDSDESNEQTTYLQMAFETYYAINYWHRSGDDSFKTSIKEQLFEYDPLLTLQENDREYKSEVLAHEITVSSGHQLKKMKVGLANMKVDEKNYERSMLGRPNLENRYLPFAKVLNEAETEECDLVVLPELSLPISMVPTIIDHAARHNRAVISGIEHWTSQSIAHNFILTVLPCQVRGINDAVPLLRLKNHYAPIEEYWINEYRRIVPKPVPYRYHLYRWRGLYFTVYYCFELGDILHRAIFRSKLDFLVASEWNPDINYYSNITEATTRDLHCYFIQVNTSQYGDSRVTQPTRTEQKDTLRVKGGQNTVLLTAILNIETLRDFQYKGFGLQKDDKRFKPTPADYRHEDARKRQENMSFKKNNDDE